MQPEIRSPEPLAMVQPAANGEGTESFTMALRAAIGDRTFDRWFHRRTAIRCDGDRLLLEVASSFQLTWMQKRFASVVTQCARTTLGTVQVVWSIVEPTTEPSAGEERLPDDLRASQPNRPGRDREEEPGSETKGKQRTLFESPDKARPTESASHDARRFCDLADFVSGRCNELALTASRHVSAAPGEQYNPLYLHGGVGTGKTHLAEGIYREIRRRNRSLRIVFMTAEQFANQFTSALRSHALPGFRQRFRTVDVLIVDDISFFGGKRAIQEEFLHTARQLLSHGRQLVVTSDVHPRLLQGVCSELTSRFLSGLVCRLEAPDLETRKRIVRHRTVHCGSAFPEKLLDYVARRFVNSVRELEGAMKTLESWYEMTGRPVLFDAGRQVLSDLERDCIRVVRLPEIESVVCRLFGLESDDLKSDRRTRAVSQPRMLAMFLARRHTKSAYKEIGEYFGGRNHSTVISAEKKVEGWLKSSNELLIGGRSWSLCDIVESLEQQLQAG